MFPWNMVSVSFVVKDTMNRSILNIMKGNVLLGNLKVVSEGEGKASERVINMVFGLPPWLMWVGPVYLWVSGMSKIIRSKLVILNVSLVGRSHSLWVGDAYFG